MQTHAAQTTHPGHRLTALAHITDKAGRLLMLKVSHQQEWALPGGTALAGESPVDALTYHLRRTLQLQVTPRRVLLVDHSIVNSAEAPDGDTTFVFECGTLRTEQIKAIKLQPTPTPHTGPEVLAFAFLGPTELKERIRPHQHRRILTAAEVITSGGGVPYLSHGREITRRTAYAVASS